jgi:hypothetical protein
MVVSKSVVKQDMQENVFVFGSFIDAFVLLHNPQIFILIILILIIILLEIIE